MMEFYDAVDTPNPMHGAAFPKKTNLPISIIPYWKPPHLVRVMVPVDDLLKNIGTDTWMYGFSKILPANVQEFVSTMPGAEELFYHQREHRSDPKLDKELFVTIWTSTNKAISPIHFDTSNIFHGVLQGRKSFIFVPPSDIMNLYTYPVYHPSYRNSMVCLTCPKPKGEVDHLLRKYPLLRNIKKFYVANLQPGEAVAFPSYWAHEVGYILVVLNPFSKSIYYVCSILYNTLSLLKMLLSFRFVLFLRCPLMLIVILCVEVQSCLMTSGNFHTRLNFFSCNPFSRTLHMVCLMASTTDLGECAQHWTLACQTS
eukprot:m.152349 g.152349  ORF g.152349 m.152349 type:complete len:313 (-) comp13300_c0_seq15:462-1400(-)